MFRRKFLTLVVGQALVVASCEKHKRITLMNAFRSDKELSKWSKFVEDSGLSALFEAPRPLTVLAPRDRGIKPDILARFEKASGEAEAHWRARLADVVRSRTIVGRHDLAEITSKGGARLQSLNGTYITFSDNGTANLTVSWENQSASAGSAVTDDPVITSNGIIYELDEMSYDVSSRTSY